MKLSPKMFLYVFVVILTAFILTKMFASSTPGNHIEANDFDIIIPAGYSYDPRSYPILIYYIGSDQITIKEMGSFAGSEEDQLKLARNAHLEKYSIDYEKVGINVSELLNIEPEFILLNERKWLVMDKIIWNMGRETYFDYLTACNNKVISVKFYDQTPSENERIDILKTFICKYN